MRKFNAVVLGAGGVGKSALVARFVRDIFVEHYDPTIEEEYHRNMLVDGELLRLDILDTAGAEQFTALNEVYIKSARGFILVFSLTHEATLKEIDSVRQQIYHVKGSNTNIPIVVVGTKMDLSHEREVTRAYIQELATRWSLPFYETSAKNNWHITDVFEDLVRQMQRQYPVDLHNQKKKQRPRCVIM